MHWQKTLTLNLSLKGRVIVSEHGINGTLGGDVTDLKKYIKDTRSYPQFKPMVFKWSDGSKDDFPKLSVKVRPELVTFGVSPDQIKVDSSGVVGAGKRIKPEQLHDLVRNKGNRLIFVDGRNAREAAIGKFKNAVVLNVRHTRDFPEEIGKSELDYLKDKTIVTYCTGGIRCEILSKLMLDAGYKDVYQLDGGITTYLERFGNDGLWEGSLFVFDRRLKIGVPGNKIIGCCSYCSSPTENYVNCTNQACNELILICDNCLNKTGVCAACKTPSKAV